jgi:hypothetical protein
LQWCVACGVPCEVAGRRGARHMRPAQCGVSRPVESGGRRGLSTQALESAAHLRSTSTRPPSRAHALDRQRPPVPLTPSGSFSGPATLTAAALMATSVRTSLMAAHVACARTCVCSVCGCTVCHDAHTHTCVCVRHDMCVCLS